MSRICGIIRSDWSRDQLSAGLDRLCAPLIHSSDFDHDRRCLDTVAFGRTFFKSLNFSTHLFASPDASVMCAFTGYLFDLESLGRQVLQEGNGLTVASNPAALIAYLFPRHRGRWLANLSGSYTFALWESNSGTLTLGTDRYGMIPLYYRHRGEQLSFASEIKALLALEPDHDTNLSALSELFVLGSPQGDQTLYPSIMRLPPATLLSFRNGDISVERYWSHGGVRPDPKLTVTEFVEEAQRLLGRSIARLTEQVARPICFLSAGYDSRRILFELARQAKPVIAYTAPTVQFDNPYTFDVPIAGALCEALGINHVTSELPPTSSCGDLARHASVLLDFETDSHAWILPLLAKLPAGAGVNFDGLGGDVLFQFNWTFEEQAAHLDDPAYLAQAVLQRYPNFWNSYFRVDAPELSLTERFEQMFRSLPDCEDRLTFFYFGNWTRRKTALFSHGLLSLKIDSVFPFLDYDLVDHVSRLSPVARRSNAVSKAMLFHTNPDIMRRIPTSHVDSATSGADTYHSSFDSSLSSVYRDSLPRNYWLHAQASINRAAAVDILRTGGVLGQLSRKAQLSVMAQFAPCPNRYMPKRMIKSSWRLPLIGLYARQRRTARSSTEAARQLAAANSFIYGR